MPARVTFEAHKTPFVTPRYSSSFVFISIQINKKNR